MGQGSSAVGQGDLPRVPFHKPDEPTPEWQPKKVTVKEPIGEKPETIQKEQVFSETEEDDKYDHEEAQNVDTDDVLSNNTENPEEKSTKKGKRQKTELEAMQEWNQIEDKYSANGGVDLSKAERGELWFIQKNFKQRICTKFSATTEDTQGSEKICKCGLSLDEHTESVAVNKLTDDWSNTEDTATIQTLDFGCMDGDWERIKYIRVDDMMGNEESKSKSNMDKVYKLLTTHWQLTEPELVISLTGGYLDDDNEDVEEIMEEFTDNLSKTVNAKKTWVLTSGVIEANTEFSVRNNTAMIAEFLEDEGEHTSVIGMPPWGILSGTNLLEGEHFTDFVDYDEAHENVRKVDHSLYFLQTNHKVQLLCDDGTHGQYKKEPDLRDRLEKYLRQITVRVPDVDRGESLPLILIVLGGDQFTIEKVASAVQNNTAVVVVNGTGDIANMLAEMVQALNKTRKSDISTRGELVHGSDDLAIEMAISEFKGRGVFSKYSFGEATEKHLKQILKNRFMVLVFGDGPQNITDLDMAISLSRIAESKNVQEKLDVAVLTDNKQQARDIIMKEKKKDEEGAKKLVQEALLRALKAKKTAFVELIMDFESDVKVDLMKIGISDWLHTLYNESLHTENAVSKVLKSLTGIMAEKKFYTESQPTDLEVMPQELLMRVGKIIFKLVGNNYRILYQEEMFQPGYAGSSNQGTYMKLTTEWHIFIWAVLSNEREIAELFWYNCQCKMGTALLACKLFKELALKADVLRERKLCEDLEGNAEHFEKLALTTLDNLYASSRYEAYKNLTASLPYELGEYLTPMLIAYDSGARNFLGHACCQRLLKLIWMNSMDLDTSSYKLVPFISASIIHWIKFEDEVLKYARIKPTKTQELPQQQPQGMEKTPKTSMQRKKSIRRREQQDSTEKQIQQPQQPQRRDMTLKRSKSTMIPEKTESTDDVQNTSRVQFMWFCVKSYFTAPVCKFANSFVSYMILLGLFTHFVLTELKPLDSDGISGVTVYEWIIYVWVFSLGCQEVKQVTELSTSGPLYKMDGHFPLWSKVWSLSERISFRMFKLTAWLTDVWNFIDGLMLTMFLVSVVLRFALEKQDFAIARICFCITLLLYYFRFLRFGYVLKQMGPRIIVIATLLSDLVYFMAVLMVFIISFGVAFQALVDPNKEPSWELLRNVFWRGYWQMLGEIFLDDSTEGMGLEVAPRNCTNNRDLASAQPDIYEFCPDWFLPVLLGLFMMITNILLLNLLIAIFSHSFEEAEGKSVEVWQYHLYDLYREYYSLVWLAPPLNLIWYVVRIVMSVVNKCRQRFGNMEENGSSKPFAMADNLFCLSESYRNDDLETKVLRDHLKQEKKKQKENQFKDLEKQMHKIESKINTDDLHKEIKSIKSEMLSIVTVAPYLKIWLDKKQQRKDKRKKAKKGKKPKPHKDQKKEETHEEKIEVSATEDDLDME